MKRFFKNPIKWFRRLRTSRGFGVHSPFAFDFITKVLLDREAYYYAYPEVDSLCGRTHRDVKIDNMLFHQTDFERQEARMLFRIMVKFQPQQIVEIGGSNEVNRTIIERSTPNSELHRWSRENPYKIDLDRSCMLIVNHTIDINFILERKYILEAIENHKEGIIIFSRNLQDPQVGRLFSQVEMVLSYGQTFLDGYTAVYVGYRRLPRQIYWLNF